MSDGQFFGLILIGAFLLGGFIMLVFEQGKAVGYEHGMNDTERRLKPQRRVYEAHDMFDFATATTNDWSK